MTINRPIAALAALWLLTAPCEALAQKTGAAESAVSKLTAEQQAWQAMLDDASAGRYEAALDRLRPLMSSQTFKALTPDQQNEITALQGALAAAAQRWPEAQQAFRRITASPNARLDWWVARTQVDFAAKDYEDAVTGVLVVIRRRGETEDTLDDAFIRRLALTYAPTATNGDALQARLVDGLFDAGWDTDASSLWRMRAGQLLDAGQTERAAAFAAKTTSAGDRMIMSIDRRFDPLRETLPQAFDVAGALADELSKAEAKVAAPEANLEDRSVLAWALIQRARNDEALNVINAGMPREDKPTAAPVDPHQLIWALDARSRAFTQLGRWDEAVADLRRAARRPENGGQNVSHAINLGWLYMRLGRNDEALGAVADIDDASMAPYGRMQRAQVQICALHGLSRETETKAKLAWIREHASDDPAALTEALVCTGQVAAAAQEVLARLNDPKRRSDVLLMLQTYMENGHETAWDRRHRDTWAQIIARPDVQAAVARFGRIETWPLTEPPIGGV